MPVEYSPEFQRLIEDLAAPKRQWPNHRQFIADNLDATVGRYAVFKAETLPEIEYHCGDLSRQRVLDFGCGTGATTAALAERARHVLAYDIDATRVAICERRVLEHGVGDRVAAFAGRFQDAIAQESGFDVVVLNGVLEHLPASEPGLRRSVLSEAAAAVRPGGRLFINDTPNRLWPRDLHTTQLWWIPWTPPGSAWAYRRAVAKGRYRDSPDLSAGPRGMEEAGAWGMSYWAVAKTLRSLGFACLNLRPGHDRRIRYAPLRRNRSRGWFEAVFYVLGPVCLRAPQTAFLPNLTNLVFERQALPSHQAPGR